MREQGVLVKSERKPWKPGRTMALKMALAIWLEWRSQDTPDSSKFRARKGLEFTSNVGLVSTGAFWASVLPLPCYSAWVSERGVRRRRAGLGDLPPTWFRDSYFVGFLHSGSSIKGPDSRKDLETTYSGQTIAKPVFISLCVCVLKVSHINCFSV